jgi:hypothetical protein
MSKTYKDDIGTVVIVDCGEDISSATTSDLIVLKPGDSTEYTWSGIVYNDNFVKYTTVAGNFDTVGIYKIQPYVVLTTWAGLGETVEIRVHDRFE